MLIICVGLPGCGKSTWSREVIEADRKAGRQTVRVNRDSLRTMLHFDEWSKENEKLTVLARNATLNALLSEPITVICDDTNLDPRVREELTSIARIRGHAVLINDFTDVPLDVCIERDSQRTGKARVGAKVILDMYARYLSTKESNG